MANNSGRQIADLRSGEAEVLPEEPAADPTLGRVKLWAVNDAFNGLRLKFKLRGRHATVEDSLNTVVFIAREIGDPGNDIQVELVAAEAGETLSATFNRYLQRLTVLLATTLLAVKASATTNYDDDHSDDRDLTFTATTAGSAGNNISVVYDEAGDEPVDETTADLEDGPSIHLTLEGSPDLNAYRSIDDANSTVYPTDLPPKNDDDVGTDTFDPYAGFGAPAHFADGPFTIEVDIKLSEAQLGTTVMVCTQNLWGAVFVDTDGTVRFVDADADAIAHSSVPIVDTDWHFLRIEKSGPAVFLFLDGVDVTVDDTAATVDLGGVHVYAVGQGADGNDYVVSFTVWHSSVDGTVATDGGGGGGTPPGTTRSLDVALQVDGSGDSIATVQDVIAAIALLNAAYAATVAPDANGSDVIEVSAADQSLQGGYEGAGFWQFADGVNRTLADGDLYWCNVGSSWEAHGAPYNAGVIPGGRIANVSRYAIMLDADSAARRQAAVGAVATAADVKAAIEANDDCAALIDVTFAKEGGTGAGIVSDDDSFDLDGGDDDNDAFSTNDEVKALVDAMPDASKVLSCQLDGSPGQIVGATPVTNLDGGDSNAVFVGELFNDD